MENNFVFLDLVSRVIRRVLFRFPGQVGCQRYEPRIYRTLVHFLRKATLQEFEVFLSGYVHFARNTSLGLDRRFHLEFIQICNNVILHWVFVQKGNPDLVRTLMEKMLGLMQESNVNLALIWRPFTPVYSPSRLEGVTPLLYVAQIRQSSILKILLQYGLLERERCPMHILLTILFYPPSPHILDELYYRNIIDDTKDCIALCARVLTRISVSDVETQIDFGRDPLIADWKDYIPVTRYRDPCELSHLCRATIRWCLLGRINLPKGIRELPLPPALQRFLNLES